MYLFRVAAKERAFFVLDPDHQACDPEYPDPAYLRLVGDPA